MQESDLIGSAIEVSGSSSEGFAERSTMDSSGSRQKTPLLRNAASNRALIFIRAVSVSGWTESHPEAQQRVDESEPSGRLRFSRLQLTSFPAYPAGQCEPKVPAAHPISVRDEVKS